MDLKNSPKTIKSIGFAIYSITIFAVLFDPTEAALGAQFMDVGPIASTIAQALGNITWILGILYALISLAAIAFMASAKAFEQCLESTREDGTIKNYKEGSTTWMLAIFSGCGALIALGSGFWFVGFFWLVAVIACRVLSSKVRGSAVYKDYVAK